MEKNLTTGSVFGNIVRFSLPYLLSYFLQTLYGMADLFIVGQYEGVAATTAVSIGSQVMHMLTVMLVGLAMGTTVSIAQAVSAGDRPRAAACTAKEGEPVWINPDCSPSVRWRKFFTSARAASAITRKAAS